MKTIKILLLAIMIFALAFGIYNNANADEATTVLQNNSAEVKGNPNYDHGAPDRDVKISEMTEDRIYYRYVYDNSLTEEENCQAQIDQALREIKEDMCKETVCNPDDFKPIPDEDIISSGIINENNEIEIK